MVARAAVIVVVPAPRAVVSFGALRLSALPVIERSAPGELKRVVMPARVVVAVPPRVATPEATDATYWLPLARSMAVVRSPTVAVDCALAGAPRETVVVPLPSVTTMPTSLAPAAREASPGTSADLILMVLPFHV